MGKEDSDRKEVHVDREVDWFFKNASPNPDRTGCPSEQTLRELAKKSRPISDPGYEHLSRCSPCYQQFRRYQADGLTESAPRAAGKLLAVAAGVLLTVAAVSVLWWFGRSGSSSGGTVTEVALVDLRGFLVTRGAQGPPRTPIKLARADVRADILLPVGLEKGRYDLRLVNGSLVTVFSVQAEAALENRAVKIHTSMPLSNLHAGQYQLALRRAGEDWLFYPITVE